MLIEIHTFIEENAFENVVWKKWLPFCLGLNVLKLPISGIETPLIYYESGPYRHNDNRVRAPYTYMKNNVSVMLESI